MYAVIESGGKQYKVSEGSVVRLEKIEKGIGETVELDKVMMVGDDDNVQVGQPYVEGRRVQAEVIDQGRGRKLSIIKFKRRKHHMRRQGHRQYYTAVRVKAIN